MSIDFREQLPRPPAVKLMRALGLNPDPWQVEVLEGTQPRLLLNCCRQAGKSTAVAMLSLAEALFVEKTKVLLVSRSRDQSKELYGIVRDLYHRFNSPIKVRDTMHELRLSNGSRIISLPCNEQTIRGHSGVHLLIVDEAARVPDDIFTAVTPMLAATNGRLICLSTPYGKRGFFYKAWKHGGSDWHRIEIPVDQVSRITKEYRERERRMMSEASYKQEFCCSFGSVEGLVYPNFARQVTFGARREEIAAKAYGRKVGGIDFGFRNPFAAVWGVLDHNDILWLTGEHYCREKPLSHHAQHLPKEVFWAADPQGAGDISEMRHASFKIVKANNAITPGIAAVSARLENQRLRVCDGCCPNLLMEAELYRYDGSEGEGSEKPKDEYNHALGALRYLVMRIDAHKLARPWWKRKPESLVPDDPSQGRKPVRWLSIYNEALWTPLGTFRRD